MSWIGLTDKRRKLFNPAGLGAKRTAEEKGAALPNEILPTGTLVLETRFVAELTKPQCVLRYERHKEWLRFLSIALTADGRVLLRSVQGGARFKGTLRAPVPEHDTPIRLYFSWNGPERWARIAMETIRTGEFHVVTLRDPLPMPMLDVLTMMRNGHTTEISAETAFVAVSDKVEPIGLGAGVCTGTPVETPSGVVAIERLRLGDRVVTATAGVQEVRWIIKREVPALGGFRPVRIRAPFFGLSQDLLMSPDHRILVQDAEAEYLLGHEDVLLPAERLVGSHAAQAEAGMKTVTYYQILLDRHDCLLHGGAWSESLFVGQIGTDRAKMSVTPLGDMTAAALPRHRGFARHRLTDTEARSLASVLHR